MDRERVLEYAQWLDREIARIEGGGEHAPWLTKEEDLQRLKHEREWAKKTLNPRCP